MFSSSSNDVVDINSDDDEDITEIIDSDKPIIQLFKRLITSDNKQHTILTNAQIVDILHKEFNIIISNIHELEGDIYLTIMKKYLKDWPQWDEFDKLVNELKKKNDYVSVNKVLQTNYISLRQYLKDILDFTEDLAKKAVQKTVDEELDKKTDNSEGNDERTVVLEVRASRSQLNQLFFREPNPEFNNSIFNSTYSVPTQISCNVLPLEAILNWWGVCIGISTSTNNLMIYRREITHEVEHVLVNRHLISRFNPLKVLDQDLKINNASLQTKIDRSDFVKFIDNLTSAFSRAKDILEFIKKDLELLPNVLYSKVAYKRYTNKYPYVRYLYKDNEIQDGDKTNDINKKKYDIQLKETVSPQYKTYIGKMIASNKNLFVQCLPCNFSASGTNLIDDLRLHFNQHHNLEPDWKCTNCSKSFSMAYLAQNWWTHRC
ncbi:unnamed protein product, partial [Brenthis ino]